MSLHLQLILSEYLQWKNKNKNTALVQLYWEFAKIRLLCINETFICLYTYVTCVLMYLCHLYAHLCNAWQFTQYAKNSHLNITAGSMIQVIISKGKQVNPKGAVSLHFRLRIHAMKEQEQEHRISTTVLIVCKNKRLLCIDKSFICLYTYVTCALMYLCHLYAHLCNAWQFTQYAKNSHLNITAGSMVQVVISK